MSFSAEIKKELAEIKNKRPCCKTNFLLGILLDSNVNENNRIETSITGTEIFDIVYNAISGACKSDIDVSHEIKLGSDIYKISFVSEKLSDLLKQARQNENGELQFRNTKCNDGSCQKSFLRGVFIAAGTVSEPQSGYHLELKFKNTTSAAFVYKMLVSEGMEPGIVNRRSGSSVGLYFKNSTAIEDILTYLGSVRCTFDFINAKIERELRNSVNRSTNCVAGNIAKSVNAAQKQLAAISALGEAGKLSMLPDELFETARLRLENPSMSLAELAINHNPPISKSGLTHRLAKIIEISEELK